MKYRDLPEPDRYPGSHLLGEIEIESNEEDLLPVVYENKYLAIVNDRVVFPGGRKGSYLRIFHQSELAGRHGTVMLPRKDRHYVLLRIFRHTTRAWELECPRGFAEPGLSAEENARQEIREELRVDVAHLECLGDACPDTGLMTTRARVFLADLDALPRDGRPGEPSEAIESFRVLNGPELLHEVAAGSIRDGFTLSAVLLAIAAGKF